MVGLERPAKTHRILRQGAGPAVLEQGKAFGPILDKAAAGTVDAQQELFAIRMGNEDERIAAHIGRNVVRFTPSAIRRDEDVDFLESQDSDGKYPFSAEDDWVKP